MALSDTAKLCAVVNAAGEVVPHDFSDQLPVKVMHMQLENIGVILRMAPMERYVIYVRSMELPTTGYFHRTAGESAFVSDIVGASPRFETLDEAVAAIKILGG